MTEIVAASGDDEELKEALDEFALAISRAPRDVNGRVRVEDNVAPMAARGVVESLFGRIKEERDRLKNLVFSLEEDVKYAKCDTSAALAQMAGFKALNVEANVELESLRSSSLTPEEAKRILPQLAHNFGCVFTTTSCTCGVARIQEKLRKIAGPPDKKEQ